MKNKTLYQDYIEFETKYLKDDHEAIKDFKYILRRLKKETVETHGKKTRFNTKDS